MIYNTKVKCVTRQYCKYCDETVTKCDKCNNIICPGDEITCTTNILGSNLHKCMKCSPRSE